MDVTGGQGWSVIAPSIEKGAHHK